VKRYCSETQRILVCIKEVGPEGNVDKAKCSCPMNNVVQNHDINISFNVVRKF
jgi:hypothetical protein